MSPSNGVETLAYRMLLNPGCGPEYRRRHEAVWPELKQALLTAGVLDFRIYLDEASHALFAHVKRRRDHDMDLMAELPVMRRWWEMMADIMATHPDDRPVETLLEPMFALNAVEG
jgi:L-rhamnose mutarotase